MAWQVEINGSGSDSVLVRHRFKGGHAAGRANILASGRSTLTGHTHQAGTARISHGPRHLWGVDAGCIAALNSRAFWSYTEGAAAAGMSNWASGFAVLTFADGLLLPPEPVLVLDEQAGVAVFRGQLISVGAGTSVH
jgi:hypothetical protein